MRNTVNNGMSLGENTNVEVSKLSGPHLDGDDIASFLATERRTVTASARDDKGVTMKKPAKFLRCQFSG